MPHPTALTGGELLLQIAGEGQRHFRQQRKTIAAVAVGASWFVWNVPPVVAVDCSGTAPVFEEGVM